MTILVDPAIQILQKSEIASEKTLNNSGIDLVHIAQARDDAR
jgi:hypothetical protein